MLTFQEAILRLQDYWAEQGALIWQPYSEKVGAGTMNPATVLRVLGPEPWNVAYPEPSFRADDGRYADNPNRMQMHTQMQVILKPDPGDPQERYLASLEALGIRREEHDIRFVEDNWESPLIGAWGLGWEVWLDGQEITQFTYFQQAGGLTLDIPAVEITYGLERIVMYLQHKRSVWDIQWDAAHTYGEILRDQEVDYCRYNFDYAGVERLQQMYELFEAEALLALDHGLVVPSLDYILRCSQTFNVLDARGTVGVTERAALFKRMRDLTRRVAEVYLEQRKAAGMPWVGRRGLAEAPAEAGTLLHLPMAAPVPDMPAAQVPLEGCVPFLFEIGTEELPASHVSDALAQLTQWVPEALDDLRLDHGEVHIWGTPRRLAVFVEQLAGRQRDEERIVKGPPASAAYDAGGAPTRAAQGFARSRGVDVADLDVREMDGGEYVVAHQRIEGAAAVAVLADALPNWVARLHFPRSMRWNETGVAFSRPIRWFAALLDEQVIAFEYAGVESGRVTTGPRPAGSPGIALASAGDYPSTMASYGIMVDVPTRQAEVLKQAQAVVAEVGGQIPDDAALLEEVANLVEVPTAILGSFEETYLALPQEVLIAVMEKHQRYFPVLDGAGKIMAYFVTIRNGGREHADLVRQGNEDVIRARYADAAYFYSQDRRQPLEAYREGLAKLTFQADLGSMLDKSKRLEALAPYLGSLLDLSDREKDALERAAYLAKADLATKMVVEMTSLQGIMGREYARLSGEAPEVADAIFEHYLPRSAGDRAPLTRVGTALAIADRVDSLAGLFSVGMAPTGSADPYGLRRAAAGVVQILLEKSIDLPLRPVVNKALENLPVEVDASVAETVLAFIAGRLEVALREMGLAYDAVAAALAARGENPTLALESARQLSGWVEREDWPLLLDNYARCVRITRDQPRLELIAEDLVEEEEKALYQALLVAEAQVSPPSDVNTLMRAFVPLVPHIQRFFDEVLVMAEDEVLRRARLALLQRIAALADGIVDLSKLEGF
ncbi:MAG: glycine--tRNA ligase subunit beta [Anaerolineae bacterium]|nr:glycine--tRNA ligase subunit beta [Anaerolineae bacterium]